MNFARWFNEVQQQVSQFPNPRDYYLACVLTRKGQKDLHDGVNAIIGQFWELKNIPPNWSVVCHHMTVNFNPTQKDFEANETIFSRQIELQVTGLAINENACAVVIQSPVMVHAKPHITVAHSRNVSLVYSNELLKLSKIHPVNLGPFDSEFLAVKKNKQGYWPEPRVLMASYSLY